MALIDDVKTALRASGSANDGEIDDLIAAAKADLALSGITVTESDTLIKRAVILYCKANYGYDNPDADRFQAVYESLKGHLALSTDYTEVVT